MTTAGVTMQVFAWLKKKKKKKKKKRIRERGRSLVLPCLQFPPETDDAVVTDCIGACMASASEA